MPFNGVAVSTAGFGPESIAEASKRPATGRWSEGAAKWVKEDGLALSLGRFPSGTAWTGPAVRSPAAAWAKAWDTNGGLVDRALPPEGVADGAPGEAMKKVPLPRAPIDLAMGDQYETQTAVTVLDRGVVGDFTRSWTLRTKSMIREACTRA